jgi:hypothetical protein
MGVIGIVVCFQCRLRGVPRIALLAQVYRRGTCKSSIA